LVALPLAWARRRGESSTKGESSTPALEPLDLLLDQAQLLAHLLLGVLEQVSLLLQVLGAVEIGLALAGHDPRARSGLSVELVTPLAQPRSLRRVLGPFDGLFVGADELLVQLPDLALELGQPRGELLVFAQRAAELVVTSDAPGLALEPADAPDLRGEELLQPCAMGLEQRPSPV
jgi:hypothetical protein